MIRVAATSDLHLGMKFTSYGPLGALLSNARFEALERIISIANEKSVDLLVVAGDLFDAKRAEAETIGKVVRSLAEFEGSAIAILPGNHDYHRDPAEPPWAGLERASRDTNLELTLLLEPRPYRIVINGRQRLLLPAPCDARHSECDRLGWMTQASDGAATGRESGQTVIGVAHGSIKGISPDPDRRYFPMRREQLRRTQADLWIVGHTHVQMDSDLGSGRHLLVPGTPEPDGFACTEHGAFFIADIDERQISTQSFSVGSHLFRQLDFEVDSFRELERRVTDAVGVKDAASTLFRLVFGGSFDPSDRSEYAEFRDSLAKRCLYMEIDDSRFTEHITTDTIKQRYAEESFPNRILSSLLDDPDALQLASRYLARVEGQQN